MHPVQVVFHIAVLVLMNYARIHILSKLHLKFSFFQFTDPNRKALFFPGGMALNYHLLIHYLAIL